MRKKELKRVIKALKLVNHVRLERIRELIRQRNEYQQDNIVLRQQLGEAQGNQDDRLTRWRQRWTSLRDENKQLYQDLADLHALLAKKEEELKEARRLIQYQQYAAMVKQPADGLCPEQMHDEDSNRHDPHWCDKTPGHADIDGPSPHRCGDCKQEWVDSN